MASPLLEESIEINTSADKVWAVISDLKRMGEWSPQCKKMIVRGEPIGVGTRTININRRGPLVWPTTAKIVQKMATEISPGVMIMPHALGANISGVITSAILTGIYVALLR